MIRLIILALLGFLLYHLVRKITRLGQGKPREPGGFIDEMVQDPACGTYIPKRDALRRVIRGEEHYFCSKECMTKFEDQQP